MNAIQSQVTYSIEQCIREHIQQDADLDSAIRMASIEIVEGLCKPIIEQPASNTINYCEVCRKPLDTATRLNPPSANICRCNHCGKINYCPPSSSSLWDAINEYAEACGGDTSIKTISDRRMNAVATIERIAKATGK